MSTLTEYIKSREEKSLSEWAEAFGISRTYLYGLMDGTRTPSPEVAMRIAGATANAIPASGWPNIAAMLEAADAIRITQGGNQ